MYNAKLSYFRNKNVVLNFLVFLFWKFQINVEKYLQAPNHFLYASIKIIHFFASY